jgi:hypothetical protein
MVSSLEAVRTNIVFSIDHDSCTDPRAAYACEKAGAGREEWNGIQSLG